MDRSADANFYAEYKGPAELFSPYILVKKTFGTILHFACMDKNGLRGEEKIRIILSAVDRIHVPVSLMLYNGQVIFEYKLKTWRQDADRSQTPLEILFHNRDATVGAVRLITKSLPDVVHFRSIDAVDEVSASTVFTNSLFREDDPRLAAILETLLEAAENTIAGIRGLVSTPMIVRRGIDSEQSYFHSGELENKPTALHTVTAHQRDISRLLPLLLKAWPDSLKYCGANKENAGTFLLHNVISTRGFVCQRSYQQRMKGLEILFNRSTIEALAEAFLRTDECDDFGFHPQGHQ